MSDGLTQYLRDRAARVDDGAVSVRDLYAGYKSWCSVRSAQPIGRKRFNRLLRHGVCTRFLPLPLGLSLSDVAALQLVVAELGRQRTAEGHGAAQDDRYPLGELELAGGEYLTHAGYHRRADFPPGQASDSWPWSAEAWKPKSPVRDATRGVALGIAGISRRLRAGNASERRSQDL